MGSAIMLVVFGVSMVLLVGWIDKNCRRHGAEDDEQTPVHREDYGLPFLNPSTGYWMDEHGVDSAGNPLDSGGDGSDF